MTTKTVKAFTIVGISVRTTNENGQAGKDIPALWNRFFAESIGDKIKNKASDELYCLYTDYEKDFTKPYTTVLGYKVESPDTLATELSAFTIPEKTYQVFTATGNLNEGAVYKEWEKIWSTDLNRAYTGDFEVYGAKSQDNTNAEVDIYIALK